MTNDLHRTGAFGRLPNFVARDHHVNAALLVLLAYRVTFAGTFGLYQKVCGKIVRKGLGRKVFQNAVQRGRALGLIARRQRVMSTGAYGPCIDATTFPPYGNDYRVVPRALFDGSRSVKEIATLLYVRSMPRHGVRAAEVADRFGWSERLAAKLLSSLVADGLLDKNEERRADGTLTSLRYVDPEGNQLEKDPRGLLANLGLRKKDPHTQCSSTTDGTNSKETKGSCAAQGATPSASYIDAASEEAFSEHTLLGWIEHQQADLCFSDDISSDDITWSYYFVSDAKLREAILVQGCGRINRRLLTPAGLYAFRYMVCYLTARSYDEYEPRRSECMVDAFKTLLLAVRYRIGHSTEWLNSWELIGLRLAGEASGGGEELYRRKGDNRP